MSSSVSEDDDEVCSEDSGDDSLPPPAAVTVPVAVKKRKKPKKPHVSINSLFDISKLPVDPTREAIVVDAEFLVYSPYGWTAPCHVLGIDVGRTHLGLCGLEMPPDPYSMPKCTWLAMISVPAKSVHLSTDRMLELFFTRMEFAWARGAIIVRIEQQEQVAKQNLMVASSLRSAFLAWHMATKGSLTNTVTLADGTIVHFVAYTHGAQKYDVAHRFSPTAAEDDLRALWNKGEISGPKNKPLRKELAYRDLLSTLEVAGAVKMLAFILACKAPRTEEPSGKKKRVLKSTQVLEQAHDIADSFLIGMWFFIETGIVNPTGEERKRKRARKLKG